MFLLLKIFFEYLENLKCEHGNEPSNCRSCELNRREKSFKKREKSLKRRSRKLNCEHGRVRSACYGCEINERVELKNRLVNYEL